MKKKIIIIIIPLIILIGIISFILWNNRTISKITLDINPSIEINIKKGNVIKSIKALNKDAKEIIDNNLKGKTIDEAIEKLTDNIIKKGYVKDNNVVVLIYSEGNINNGDIIYKIDKYFGNQNVHAEMIAIDNITKEDKKLASKYDISLAKAAYINQVLKDKENIPVTSLINKSTNEIKETKETGYYCEEGYVLDGSWCFKETKRVSASKGQVCPEGYDEKDGICYENTGILEKDNLVCREDYTLKDGECIREHSYDATPVNMKCNTGTLGKKSEVGFDMIEGVEDKYICYDISKATKPVLRCLTHDHTMINGKCANGPKPTINGGCETGDYLVNGGCYDIDDENQWSCPNGRIYEKNKGGVPTYCPDTLITSEPIVTEYKCDNNDVLKGNKCVVTEISPAEKERYCPSNYTLVDNARCINYQKTANKQDGYICNLENARVKDNICIIYDLKEANHN